MLGTWTLWASTNMACLLPRAAPSTRARFCLCSASHETGRRVANAVGHIQGIIVLGEADVGLLFPELANWNSQEINLNIDSADP